MGNLAGTSKKCTDFSPCMRWARKTSRCIKMSSGKKTMQFLADLWVIYWVFDWFGDSLAGLWVFSSFTANTSYRSDQKEVLFTK